MTEKSQEDTIRDLQSQIEKLTEERSDPQGVARIMSGYLNTLSPNSSNKQLVEEISFEHRTLQQNFTRLCIAWLEHCGSLDGMQYDLRNEASAMLGRSFIEKITQNMRRLPTI